MCPPFVVIASRFETRPTAMNGMPGIRKFAATPVAKRPYEMSQRTTPIRSEVCHGSTFTGKAIS